MMEKLDELRLEFDNEIELKDQTIMLYHTNFEKTQQNLEQETQDRVDTLKMEKEDLQQF